MLEKGLVGIEAKTGNVLWRANKTVSKFGATIPTPVVYDSEVYSAGSGSGGALIKLKSAGGKVEPEQVYFSPKLPTAIGGAFGKDQAFIYEAGRFHDPLHVLAAVYRLEESFRFERHIFGKGGRVLSAAPCLCGWGN